MDGPSLSKDMVFWVLWLNWLNGFSKWVAVDSNQRSWNKVYLS